jgi:hypothetical protein
MDRFLSPTRARWLALERHARRASTLKATAICLCLLAATGTSFLALKALEGYTAWPHALGLPGAGEARLAERPASAPPGLRGTATASSPSPASGGARAAGGAPAKQNGPGQSAGSQSKAAGATGASSGGGGSPGGGGSSGGGGSTPPEPDPVAAALEQVNQTRGTALAAIERSLPRPLPLGPPAASSRAPAPQPRQNEAAAQPKNLAQDAQP